MVCKVPKLPHWDYYMRMNVCCNSVPFVSLTAPAPWLENAFFTTIGMRLHYFLVCLQTSILGRVVKCFFLPQGQSGLVNYFIFFLNITLFFLLFIFWDIMSPIEATSNSCEGGEGGGLRNIQPQFPW